MAPVRITSREVPPTGSRHRTTRLASPPPASPAGFFMQALNETFRCIKYRNGIDYVFCDDGYRITLDSDIDNRYPTSNTTHTTAFACTDYSRGSPVRQSEKCGIPT